MQFATARNRVAEIRRIADASRERNGDRLAHAKDEARSWKMAFWVSTGLLAGAVGALGYVALQPRFVPYTVAVDQHGVALPIAPAERTVRGDPNAIRAELARFITDARTVSSDPFAQRTMVERAYAHAAPAAGNLLNAYFRDPANDARVIAERAVRLVRVLRVTPLPAPSSNTWNVLWQETEIEHGNESRSTSSWEAYLTVTLEAPTNSNRRTEEQISLNPLGIYVSDFSWSPVATPDPTQ
jgi:type IV secretory pathway TrbF-like protein